jgi:ribosomal protein S18 acetylase RimI-like enzyme
VTRRAADEDFGVCIEIAASLPDYFTREVVDELLPSDLRRFGAIVAEVNQSMEGFLVAHQKTPRIADILWLAVRERAQGKGVGAALLEGAADAFCAAGVLLLEVKTLAPTANEGGYKATRRFYESHGFEILEIIDPYPGWNPGNPCAIYVKPLFQATR